MFGTFLREMELYLDEGPSTLKPSLKEQGGNATAWGLPAATRIPVEIAEQ